jgi:hypothetical protein
MATKTRARSISTLKPGEKVRLKFHGSKQIGNDPYELEASFVEFTEDGNRAVFDEVEAYKFNSRWCYGSGAHKLSILETL